MGSNRPCLFEIPAGSDKSFSVAFELVDFAESVSGFIYYSYDNKDEDPVYFNFWDENPDTGYYIYNATLSKLDYSKELVIKYIKLEFSCPAE